MSWIGKVFSAGAGELIGKIGDVADNFITTGDEKLAFKKAVNELVTSAFQQAEQQRTDRHAADMKSDSWLSKNIRPMVLIYLMTAFTLFAVGSVSFEISPSYIEMLSEMLKWAFGFYFGGRSAEKIAKIVKGDA